MDLSKEEKGFSKLVVDELLRMDGAGALARKASVERERVLSLKERILGRVRHLFQGVLKRQAGRSNTTKTTRYRMADMIYTRVNRRV